MPKQLKASDKYLVKTRAIQFKGDAAPQFYGVFGQSALYKTFVFRHIHD